MNIRSIFSAISFLRTQAGSENKESAAIDSNQNINNDSLGQVTLTSLDRALVVVDIGCRWGFAERFTKNVGYFRVYGFDPDKVECQRLNDLYKSESVTLVPLGLAQTAGKRTLYITKEPACSSLLEPDPMLTSNYPALNCAQHVSSVEVETTTLDIWTKESCIDNVDYIKVDTQGSELEILTGGINTLKGVRSLEVEVEFNSDVNANTMLHDIGTSYGVKKLTSDAPHWSYNGH